MVLTETSRRTMIAAADKNPALRTNIETVLGVAWDSLTADQKIGALTEHEEVGYAVRSVAAAADGFRALERAAQEVRDDVSLADRVSLLEEQISAKDQTVARLENDNRRLRGELAAAKATGAMAVHSGEAA
jgi:hypothetical protein